MRRPSILVSLVLGAVVATGCDKPKPAPKLKPPTVEQAEKFAAALTPLLNPCSESEIRELWDLDVFVDRVLANKDISARDRRLVRTEAMDATTLCPVGAAAGATYQFIRVTTVDGAPRPIYRLDHPDGALNYTELVLTLDRRGDPKIVDTYLYTSGGLVSTALRSLIDRLQVTPAESMQELGNAVQSGDQATARRLLAELPTNLRASKEIMLIEIQLSFDDDKAYAAAMEKYRTAFPDDPAIDMMAVDANFLKGDFAGAVAALDRIERRVGGDPFLETLRAGAYLEAKQPDQAVAALRRGVDKAPWLSRAWHMLIGLHVQSSEFPEAVAVLQEMKAKQPAFDQAELETLEFWPALASSEPYLALAK